MATRIMRKMRKSWIKFSLLLTSSPVAVFLSLQPSQSLAFVASNNDFVIYGISVIIFVNIFSSICLSIFPSLIVPSRKPCFVFAASNNALVIYSQCFCQYSWQYFFRFLVFVASENALNSSTLGILVTFTSWYWDYKT